MDVYVPGCSVRPEQIIDGVVKALGILEEKRAAFAAENKGKKNENSDKTDKSNAGEKTGNADNKEGGN